ncbi:MAG: hypothetical protein ACK2UO_19465, partial [Caldilineaceae bacterium]
VVGFDEDAEYRGLILDELDSLTARGLIRVIDLQFVKKDEAGDLIAIQGSDLTDEEAIEFGAVIGGLIGLGAAGEEGAAEGMEAGALAAADEAYGLTVDDIADIASGLEPGQAVGMLLFEHTWAARLKQAIRTTGGYPIAQGFLTPEALMMVGRELEAVLEAEVAIEVADAVKGAAILDAIATVEAAEQVKAVAVAEAIQTLIVAGLIEDAAAQEAIDAVVAAGLIEDAALTEAEQAVAEAEAEMAAARAAISAATDAADNEKE